jgi:hypothetical protein
VCRALAREGIALPVRPPLIQFEVRQLRHDVDCHLTIVANQPVATKHGVRDDFASGETRAQRLAGRTVSVL